MQPMPPDPLAATVDHGRAPAERMPLPPLVATRYEIGRHLASGGLGDVYLARDARLARDVALKVSHGRDGRALVRFRREASITARLEHPAIIPVHDRGQLDDGRAWFTMRLVRGRTLGEVIAARALEIEQGSETSSGLRRLIEVLVRVTEAVAYAHEQGVVHCDLKPANIMVGHFGEVQVMDWGLARAFAPSTESLEMLLHQDDEGGLAGTPIYMSPEQALGLPVCGPVTDLWGLGGLLLEIIAGKPPFGPETGPPWPALSGAVEVPSVTVRAGQRAAQLPAELVELCALARLRDPAERLADAGDFADALRGWLDGARRTARALARVRAADERVAEMSRLRGCARRDRARAAELAAELDNRAAADAWRPIWALEDRAARFRRDAEQAEAAWKQDLRAALKLDPGLSEAHERLADHYVDRIRRAEAARRPAAVARAETQLGIHARARHRRFLAGEGTFELTVDPPDAEVELMRHVDVDRRLVARSVGLRAVGPTIRWSVSHGSYLAVVRARGRATVRLPVVIERGETWRLVGPGESEARVLRLPPAESVGPDEVLVPAGWCIVGGDPVAPDAPERRRIWLEGFVMGRDPVTVGQWLAFLEDLERGGRGDRAERFAPHGEPTATGARSTLLTRTSEGRLVLRADPAEHGARPVQSDDLPINRVDWTAAMAYAAWRAARTGQAWRLPDEFEWEKAARGADGRLRPWGDYMLPRWAVVLDGFAGPAGRQPVGVGPLGGRSKDVSPYGIRGLAGNVRTWCINVWQPGGSRIDGDRLVVEPADPADVSLRAVRGSAWSATVPATRCAARYADPPDRRFSSIGVRLVRPWPEA